MFLPMLATEGAQGLLDLGWSWSWGAGGGIERQGILTWSHGGGSRQPVARKQAPQSEGSDRDWGCLKKEILAF